LYSTVYMPPSYQVDCSATGWRLFSMSGEWFPTPIQIPAE
jgi:hypothetical protein